jgi:class 3 adenylate cyclase/tetratricopeptide (TPR) repeat protein
LFADLVDFTPLSVMLDPEDLRDVLHAFRDAARPVVRRHEGSVASYMGDGIMIFFAYPRAHEDDPARAVRAGLEIVAAVAELEPRPGVKLRARVGIATGLAVIGNLLDEEGSLAVVGQVANLAARLQSITVPSTVVISATTRKLVGAEFECVALEPQRLKGFDQPVPAWRVVGEKLHDGEATPTPSGHEPTPLSGRRDQLELLRGRWALACAGHGQLVLLRGEPGIGKTRLAQALRSELVGQPHVVLPYLCSQRFQNTALSPVMRLIRQSAGLGPLQGVAEKLDRIEAFVADLVPVGERTDNARHLAALLSIPFDGRYPPIIDSPERVRQRTLACLEAQLRGVVRQTPVLIVFEDVHWADPTTIDLIVEIVGKIESWSVLVVVTARPEFLAPWPHRPYITTVDLARLGPADAARIVEHLTSQKTLPQEVLAQVLSKSEGVPLFIEELTKTVLESGLLEETEQHYTLTGPLPALAVPSTLHDSLMARLDRLSLIKEVAQVAAAIGREFTYDLLGEVMSIPELELRAGLNRLVDAEIISFHDRGKPRYSFRHALIQEAAYSTMLRGTRRRLHRRIAETIEARFAETTSAEPEQLAHHWREAGDALRAIPYLQQAGTRAASRGANTEARRHFLAALELAAHLGDKPERPRIELALLVRIGLATSASSGYAAPDVESAYRRALDLSRAVGDHAEHFPVIRGLATFYIVRADLSTARELSEQCLRVGEESQRPEHLIEGCTALGYTAVYQGELGPGYAHLARAVDLYEAQGGDTLSYPTSQDPAVASLSLQSVVAWMRGDTATADRCRDRALALATRLGAPFNLAYARCFAAMLHNLRHDFASAARYAAEALSLAQEHGFSAWVGASTMHHAMATGMTSDPATAAATLEYVIGLWQAGGAELNISLFLVGLAACRRAEGKLAEASATVDRARDHARSHGETFLESEICRVRGEIRHAIDPRADWRGDLDGAIVVARAQGACALEIRALRSLLDRIDPLANTETSALQARLDTLAAALT